MCLHKEKPFVTTNKSNSLHAGACRNVHVPVSSHLVLCGLTVYMVNEYYVWLAYMSSYGALWR